MPAGSELHQPFSDGVRGGKAQLSVGRGERKNRWFLGHARAFFFLKGTAFEPPRRVILVYTPTESDGPGFGPIGVSSQTRCVCFVGGCQELHHSSI